MRRLVLEEWVSLDGYAVDARGSLDFFPSTEQNRAADRDQLAFLERVDTILLARKSYEMFADYWPTPKSAGEIIADRLNALPKVVFSNTLREAPWGDGPPATVVPGDAVAAIREMKAAPGKDLVMWGSLSLAQQLMRADLIDEYHVQICPVLVGGGRPLFADRDAHARLRLVETRHYEGSGLAYLHYEPVRDA
ncbi:dihydrofolate reductase family protein [Roseisolibacter sp. H3M3-2]|uniref:dihydrofolate reductase family protein n=1 Tax=Roseisolibacter sp. H3M3-2 TaxID=3031323 RepID=UPI0023DBC531|nr:dihydrofolate reductase family protein [Roseisolibacter sp. H3M3-2]MDF1502545.1 dihydrofolate reductase family protein [Roseisolibacter sp. H3M3-2]